MSPYRRLALAAGVLYLVTIATSIPALALKSPYLGDPAPGASATPALVAALLEVLLALACIATAVVLYPIVRRQSETAALCFVAARTLEGAMVFAGVLALLSVVTIRRDGAAGAGSPAPIDAALVALHDWAFLLGPGLIPAVNAVCLGYVLYRSALVPRIIPAIGLAGVPLLVASAAATMFGAIDQVSPVAALAALPIAVWELSLGVWLVVKGFRPEAVVRLTGPHRVTAAA